jgi:biopolymer transport protein ExbD
MAELNTGDGGGKKGGKVRSKKGNSKVDLTAMVDLAFLLITFFMLTTSLSKPQSMDLGMPEIDPEIKLPPVDIADYRTVTVLVGDNNKIMWYKGQFTKPLKGPKATSYGKSGIRQVILEESKQVLSESAQLGKGKDGMIVLIKADKKSNYKNLIDILDEMAISKVPTYAISDITPAEIAELEK